MGNLKNLIKAIVSILVFCIGIYVLLSESRLYMLTLKTTRQMVHDNIVYQQYNITDKEIITYTELISALLRPLNYDIKINGLLIKKIEHSPEKIDDYEIAVGDYIKSYQYDEEGNITLIIYTDKD